MSAVTLVMACEVITDFDRTRIGQGDASVGDATTDAPTGNCPTDDANECTDDTCENGATVHTPKAAKAACTKGGAFCDGQGACVACVTEADCPGTDDACQTRSCTAGVCGFAFSAQGTRLPTQTTGDCKASVCDGAGKATTINDDTDLPNDSNDCTSDVCTTGVPSNPAKASNSACGTGGALFCNATGQCVGCTNPGQCLGTDDECKTRTCTVGVCGNTFAPNTKAVASQTAKNCLENRCDGAGNISAVADDTDLPVDDGNPCTDEKCTAGTPSHPNKTAGASCTDGNACTVTDTCQSGACTPGAPVVCTAQDQCHVAGTCDTSTGVCSNPNKANGENCSDGNACTDTDTCQAGTCSPGTPVVCAAKDQCHVAGTCDTGTGVCTDPNKTDTTPCNDGNACTQVDTCQTGTCTGSSLVTCTVLDECHVAGVCNPGTGLCTNPNAPDTTTCSIGTCTAGVCLP